MENVSSKTLELESMFVCKNKSETAYDVYSVKAGQNKCVEVRDMKTLAVIWPIYNTTEFYRFPVHQYVSNLDMSFACGDTNGTVDCWIVG